MRKWFWGLLPVAGLAVAVGVLDRPLEPGGLLPRPDPARSYDDALLRCALLVARDGVEIAPACVTRFLLHGGRTRRAVVLFQGLTSCPRQFGTLADSLYARGCNVLVPRAPYHGYADRLTPALARLDAVILARAADEAVDIARGLGDSVTVAGISLGAVQAAWAAQLRPDVDRAVLISPAFGVAAVPAPLTPAFTRALLALPNANLWWDPRAGARVAGPPSTYPRYSTRALGQVLRLGFAVQAAARRGPAAAREIGVVTWGGDMAVSNAATAAVVREWRARGTPVTTYEFPRSRPLGHDLVDPQQPYARPGEVYPVLLRLLGR
ncbi:MAG TPA: alpha/beta fold hydrolase [Candidatus Saccharimonadales bacterium]|nr:alpha/beta fold hydrolase [Candidatus Saccharimonadales bacterium]